MKRVTEVMLGLLVAAAVCLTSCSPTPAEDVYVIQGTFEHTAVRIKVNGIPVWQSDEGDAQESAQQINGYLKRGRNTVDITLRGLRAETSPKLGLLIGRFADGDLETAPEILFRLGKGGTPARLPFNETIVFEAPDYPQLSLWLAEPTVVNEQAKLDILADLAAVHEKFKAALATKDAVQIVDVMMGLPAIGDLRLSAGEGAVDEVRKQMTDIVMQALSDPGVQMSTVTLPSVDELEAEPVTPQHFQISRKGGGALTGIAFVMPSGRTAGLFVQQPLYGRVGGKWTLLRN